MTFNQAAAAAGLVFIFAFVMYSQIASNLSPGSLANPGPTKTIETAFTRDSRSATSDEIETFEALLRLERRAILRSRLIGDVSLYPEVYFNDQTVDLGAEFLNILEEDGADAEQALARISPDKAGEPAGLLTARIAIVLRQQDDQAAWTAEQATAALEHHQTSTADMQDSTNPYPEKYGNHNVGTPQYVFDGLILNDHAEFKLAYEPPQRAALILIYTLTRVDSRWYISGERSEYRAEP